MPRPRPKRTPEELSAVRRQAGSLGGAATREKYRSLDAYVEAIVARAPALSAEQRATIRAALASTPTQQVGGATP